MKQSKAKLKIGLKGFFRQVSLAPLIFLLLLSPAQAEIISNIVGKKLDGRITSLHRTLTGKPAVINFWWVKCSPCKKELPDLIRKSRSSPEIDFIYVHAQTNNKTKTAYDTQSVSNFLEQQGISLSNVIIATTKARMSVGVEALPTTMLVSGAGQIEQTLVGFTPENTKAIANWLKSKR